MIELRYKRRIALTTLSIELKTRDFLEGGIKTPPVTLDFFEIVPSKRGKPIIMM